MGRKKKKYVEDHIFRIYPDYPLMVLDKIAWAKAGANDPLHFHYYLEIGYCYEGQGTIISEGKEAAFSPGSISLVAPNLLHATRNENGVYTMWGYLFVDLEDFVKLFSFIDERMHLKLCRQLFYGIQILDERKHGQITSLLKQIFKAAEEKKGTYKVQIMNMLCAFLFMLYDVLEQNHMAEEEAVSLPLLPAIDSIFDHYMEQIKVGELAEMCHFSESHFRKVFQKMKGLGPVDYMNCIRIREACWRLQNTMEPIRIIGEKCGYLSISSFERNFKKRMGILPAKWREERRLYRKKERGEYDIKKILVEEQK